MRTMVRSAVMAVCGVAGCVAAAGALDPGPEIRDLAANLEVGEPMEYGGLALWPVSLRRGETSRNYLTLDEAMARGVLDISEKGGGRVPEVLVSNRADLPIFIFAGEIITGARQDRVVKQDVLLAPRGGAMTVSVYCVEHGRWHGKSDRFASGRTNAPSFLRKIAQWGASQGEVWDSVKRVNKDLAVSPSSGTLQASYESRENRAKFEEYGAALGRLPEAGKGTVGVIVCSGGRILCADLFTDPALLKAEWEKLLKSYVADAMAAPKSSVSVSRGDARAFLACLEGPDSMDREKGTSLGENVRLAWRGGAAAGLLHEGAVVHLSLFPEERPVESGRPNGRVLGVGERLNLNRR